MPGVPCVPPYPLRPVSPPCPSRPTRSTHRITAAGSAEGDVRWQGWEAGRARGGPGQCPATRGPYAHRPTCCSGPRGRPLQVPHVTLRGPNGCRSCGRGCAPPRTFSSEYLSSSSEKNPYNCACMYNSGEFNSYRKFLNCTQTDFAELFGAGLFCQVDCLHLHCRCISVPCQLPVCVCGGGGGGGRRSHSVACASSEHHPGVL